MPLPQRVQELREMSWFAYLVERVFRSLQWFPPQAFLGSRAKIHEGQEGASPEFVIAQTRRVARRIDAYIAAWLLVAAIACSFALDGDLASRGVLAWAVRTLAVLRIIDIVQTAANISIFDRLRVRGTHRIASVVRTFVLSMVNYLELLIWFALIYAAGPEMLHDAGGNAVTSLVDCLYFSVVTQLTIGYGDILPVGAGRIVVVLQGLAAFFFTLVILGRLVSLLPRPGTVINDD